MRLLLPRNLRHSRQNRARAERLARQLDPVLQRDPQQRGGRDEHHAGVGAAVRELAMRAIDQTPGLDQIEDRLLLKGQQPVDRLADRQAVLQTPGLPQPRPPAMRADVGEIQHLARRVCAHPPGPHRRSAPAARAWSRRSRARGPGRKARALPSPVQCQLDRQLLQRLRQTVVLRSAAPVRPAPATPPGPASPTRTRPTPRPSPTPATGRPRSRRRHTSAPRRPARSPAR